VEAKEQLLEVGREAVRSAYQHAGSIRVQVNLEYCRRSLILRIVDDCHGFDAGLAEGRGQSTHFGLVGMRERQAIGRGVSPQVVVGQWR
jgi:signal transduction histidine kinase